MNLLPDDERRLRERLASIDAAALEAVLPSAGGVLTMMFTDIVDSSRIQKDLGDDRHKCEIREPHHRVVRETLRRGGGDEINTWGDAFFAAFASPAGAVATALEIQKTLDDQPVHTPLGPLQVRIGLHTGTPIQCRDPSVRPDLSGADVDKTARIQSIALGGQVLVSDETRAFVRGVPMHDWGRWELKNIGRHRVFEVLRGEKKPRRPSGRACLGPVRFTTRFVGRKADVESLMDLVTAERLVTLRGLGGIGKTRLADEVAVRVSQRFEDGAHFVELGEIQDSESKVAAEMVARLELKLKGYEDEATALVEELQNREMLLILDNFEAVMSAVPVVDRLLRRCPGVHVLVTSQRPLGLEAERVFPVAPMGMSPAGGAVTPETLALLDSFHLLCERAPFGWQATRDNTPTVAEILGLTDGIPLSIGIVAARLDRPALTEIRDELARNRMGFLQRAGRGEEAKRHAGIRACIDWSFGLLASPGKELFPGLSVFVGGFFADDAAAVCDARDAGTVLDRLHEVSLLEWEEAIGRTRYRMLPTVRDYARERLGEEAAATLRHRHAKHFLGVLDRADDQVQGKEQLVGIARIAADLENIRAGMDAAVEDGDHRTVFQYAEAFGTYFEMKGQFAEHLRRARQGLEAAEILKDAQRIAGAQNNLGIVYDNLPTGDRAENFKKAIDCFEAALRIYTEHDYPVDWATTQNNLGAAYLDFPTGDRAENLKKAIDCFEAALRVKSEHRFSVGWAKIQINLGNVYQYLPTGDRAENLRKAIDCYEAALRVYTEHDFPVDWAMTQNNLGAAYQVVCRGDRAENLKKAIDCFEAALRVHTERGYPVKWATSQDNLGNAYQYLPTGDRVMNLKRAIDYYKAALHIRTECDYPVQWAATQNNLGIAYQDLPAGDHTENLKKAIDCFESTLRVYTEHGFPIQWATIQNNLAAANRDLPTDDEVENIEKAISCYAAAVRGYETAGLTNDAKEARRQVEVLKNIRSPKTARILRLFFNLIDLFQRFAYRIRK